MNTLVSRRRLLAATAAVSLLVASCTPAEIDAAVAKVDAAAAQAAQEAGAIDTKLVAVCGAAASLVSAGSFVSQVAAIAPWITAGCTTADGLLKLASDPTSVQWVVNITNEIAALVPQKTLVTAQGR